jgi:hypothetical protein
MRTLPTARELVAHPHDYLYSSAKYYYNRNDRSIAETLCRYIIKFELLVRRPTTTQKADYLHCAKVIKVTNNNVGFNKSRKRR